MFNTKWNETFRVELKYPKRFCKVWILLESLKINGKKSKFHRNDS